MVSPEVCWNGVGSWAINSHRSSSPSWEPQHLLSEEGLENLRNAPMGPGMCFSLAEGCPFDKIQMLLDWEKKKTP